MHFFGCLVVRKKLQTSTSLAYSIAVRAPIPTIPQMAPKFVLQLYRRLIQGAFKHGGGS
jgi:hypothetical protein